MNLGQVSPAWLTRKYNITPIQQPELGAVMGPPLSRIPLGPPLIIQLDTWEEDGRLTIPHEELPFLVCQVILQTPSGDDAQYVRETHADPVGVPTTYGTTIATPVEMRNVDGDMGVYFVFPDVCVRYPGRFRLKAFVMRLSGGPSLTTCVTSCFTIVRQEDFVAPAITDMTAHFAAQDVVNFGPQPMQGGDWFNNH